MIRLTTTLVHPVQPLQLLAAQTIGSLTENSGGCIGGGKIFIA